MPRRVLPGLLLLALAAAASSACGSSPARRSVVLITVDTLRSDHLGREIAPALTDLAREGILFETAISVGPLTLPAHASLLTGQVPPVHGVRDNNLFALPATTPTYTAWFKSQGYHTAAFVSAVVLQRRYGLDAGFDVYDDEISGQSPERSAQDTLARAERWLSSRGEDAPPFFLWVHLFEPHAPYLAGSYAAEVTDVDRQLSRFFDVLRSRGLWKDVVLSVTSDHGESLGEHGEDTHGFFIYDSTIRIPWILKAPTLTPARFAPQVRLLDVLPTMISLAGVTTDPTMAVAASEGVDLSSFLQKGTDPGLDAYSETLLPKHQFNWSELRSIRTSTLKYIQAPQPELYRWREDPAELRNVVSSDATTASRMQAIVAQASVAAMQAPRRERSDVIEAEKFMALGYIGQTHMADPAGASDRPDPKAKVEIYRMVMSALTLSEAGKPDDALAALRRAQEMEPGLVQVHYLTGVILGGQGRYREAVAALERTVELNPGHVLARFKLALAYLRIGAPARAETVLQGVIKDEPENMRAYQNLAALAYTRGDLGRAEAMALRAIEIDAKYFDAWNTLGAVYLLTDRPADAVRALRTAVELNAASGQAQHNLSLALRAQGNLVAATAASSRACELDKRFCF